MFLSRDYGIFEQTRAVYFQSLRQAKSARLLAVALNWGRCDSGINVLNLLSAKISNDLMLFHANL